MWRKSLDEPAQRTQPASYVPDVAFNWLQVLANVAWYGDDVCPVQLLQLNKAVVRKQGFHMSAFAF